MTTAPVENSFNLPATSGKQSMALDTEEFMTIMITELTNQDPFEPMKNQDLLNQMATIQQLQSSQDMMKSFEALMERYDGLLARQELSTASSLVGQLVSGNTLTGQFAVGKVVAVNLDGQNVYLELDTGQKIDINNMSRMGGSNTQDIVGQMAIGLTEKGQRVIGKIVAVEVDNEEITLNLEVAGKGGTPEKVKLQNSSIIDYDTADLLIGMNVRGLDDVAGEIQSVKWTNENTIMLTLLTDGGELTEIPLEELTGLR
ncbi:MAG: hypothetical protein JW860_16200 [Sedimentisphaerales bacterium]|nr:hypothetical protein [Sedimentisphaerales bacterium]